MRIEIQKLKKLLGLLQKLSVVLAQHVLLTSLFLLIISLILGAVLCYKYTFLAQRAELGIPGKLSLLNEEIHQKVLRIWQEQEEKFEQADSKEQSDLFREAVPAPEELTE